MKSQVVIENCAPSICPGNLETQGKPGKVDLVPPFGIHEEQGRLSRSVAIILRSERVAGKTTQDSYDIEK